MQSLQTQARDELDYKQYLQVMDYYVTEQAAVLVTDIAGLDPGSRVSLESEFVVVLQLFRRRQPRQCQECFGSSRPYSGSSPFALTLLTTTLSRLALLDP